MMILAVFLLLADPSSITVTGGTLKVGEQEIQVGPGTFIPAPFDADLAKKIVDTQAQVDTLKVQLQTCQKESQLKESYWLDRETKVEDFYQERNKALQDQIDDLKGWWNEWGKPVLSDVVAAVVAAGGTYFIMEHK